MTTTKKKAKARRESCKAVLPALSPEASLADAEIYASLARRMERSSREREAQVLLQRALDLREQAIGSDHPVIALTLEQMAEVSLQIGEPDEAVRLHARALSMRERLHGPEHPEVAIGLASFANVLWDAGQTEAARFCHARAIAMVREAPLAQIPAELRRALKNFPGLMCFDGDERLSSRGRPN